MAWGEKGGKEAAAKPARTYERRAEVIDLELREASGTGDLQAGEPYLYGIDRSGWGVRVHFERDGKGRVLAVVSHLGKFTGEVVGTALTLPPVERKAAAAVAAIFGRQQAPENDDDTPNCWADEVWKLDCSGETPVLREVAR